MRAFLIAGCIATLMLGASASAEERDCHCSEIVLNGSLNTADFDGGVGGVVDYGGGGGGGGEAESEAHAFAHASAFAAAFSRGVGSHGGGGHHGGGGGHHGGCPGGGHGGHR
jgi:hypothetical protein